MSDPYSETDEWPTPPRYSGSSKVPATFHAPDSDGPVWRDRGVIIAGLTARVAELEAALLKSRDDHQAAAEKVARIEALTRWLVDEGHMTPVGARQIQKVLS